MDIHKMLDEEKAEELKYVPCNMPASLFVRVAEIAVAEQLSRSKVMVVAARLLVSSYDGRAILQEAQEGIVEGGGEVSEMVA